MPLTAPETLRLNVGRGRYTHWLKSELGSARERRIGARMTEQEARGLEVGTTVYWLSGCLWSGTVFAITKHNVCVEWDDGTANCYPFSDCECLSLTLPEDDFDNAAG